MSSEEIIRVLVECWCDQHGQEVEYQIVKKEESQNA